MNLICDSFLFQLIVNRNLRHHKLRYFNDNAGGNSAFSSLSFCSSETSIPNGRSVNQFRFDLICYRRQNSRRQEVGKTK